jgi:hypothetical protein
MRLRRGGYPAPSGSALIGPERPACIVGAANVADGDAVFGGAGAGADDEFAVPDPRLRV